MADPIRPVGPQPIGPLRPEGTGATGPQAPSDLFQKTFEKALERLQQAGPAERAAAAGTSSVTGTTQALLSQLQGLQQDLTSRLQGGVASPTAAMQLARAADFAYDVHRDVRDRLVNLLKAQGMVASA